MTNANIFVYSIDITGLFEHPSTIEKALRPSNTVNFTWNPQTIGDQVWVFYQFATAKELTEYSKTFQKTERVRRLNLSNEQITHWL